VSRAVSEVVPGLVGASIGYALRCVHHSINGLKKDAS